MNAIKKYIYGVIPNVVTQGSLSSGSRRKTEAGTTFGINSNEELSEVYTILHRDIACVVSNTPLEDYSSMLKEHLADHLVKHQKTIERVMEKHTIIPMKFGTSVSDDGEVIEILKRGYTQFKEILLNINGKIELDVVAAYNDLNNIIKEFGEETKEIKEFKAEIAKSPPSQTLQDRIKIGMMIKDTLDKRKEKEQVHIIDCLKEVTLDFQKHQVMDEKMILNCAFLLKKSREPDFDAKLKELDKEYKQKVNFRCVGPLPPYSFATCQLKKVGFNQIEEAKRLLGLGDKVSLKEIKESYREFAQRKHPDKYPENTQVKEEFEKITKAYKLLSSCCQEEDIFLTGENNKQKNFIVVEIIKP